MNQQLPRVSRIVRLVQSIVATLAVVCPAVAWGAEDVTFYKDVQPILKKHCTICHSDSSIDELDVSGGVSLSNPEAILKNAKHSLVTPGKSTSSSLLGRLVTTNKEKRMPKDDEPLSEEKIAVIRQWIDSGAPLGTPVSTAKTRERKPRHYQDVAFPKGATPPKAFFGATLPGPLTLKSTIGPMAPVTALAFSPDGKYLAAGSYRQVVVWDTAKGSAVTLTDPIGMVHGLGFTPDGKFLCLAGGDAAMLGEVKAYEVGSWKTRFEDNEPTDVVYGLAISPDGKSLATTSFDRYLRVYDLPGGKLRYSIKAHSDFAYCVAFSRDGKRLVTGSKDRSVKMWEAANGKLIRAFTGHNQDVLAVAFSPDGKMIYSTGMEPQIRKWDIEKAERPATVGGHGGVVYDLAWDKDWKRLVSGGADNTVRSWAPEVKAEKTLSGSTETIYSVALGPNGKVAAGGSWDGYVRLWDVASGRLQLTLVASDRSDGKSPDWLALTPTGYFSASPTLESRSKWEMSGAAMSFKDVAGVLSRPEEIAKAFTGATPTAVVFPPKEGDKVAAGNAAKKQATPKNAAKQSAPAAKQTSKAQPKAAAAAKAKK